MDEFNVGNEWTNGHFLGDCQEVVLLFSKTIFLLPIDCSGNKLHCLKVECKAELLVQVCMRGSGSSLTRDRKWNSRLY